ncbi:conserved hypothetical protein [Vibrio nigripulchritudo SO65]|uniref:DUF6796 family protein n=1 Tax=Vibrio nigripulchritudo TaxID=28173 RepID=UPI0003B1AAD4|nr:DUF6796 family protein [Vibrio nigripulchritudo]CCN41387.1 conserved hypothetical protein [Vibrio nigripulchritudo FTn2]CCN64750.1 conserved hypothetical protein [Vibrio nigripulchritudo POn4]CCN76852.1 conserved hypothetical protein [Vibrio nigripulchritudo SO65]
MKGSTYLLLGMMGAVLMYVGDMLLYFTAEPLADSPVAILLVMTEVSDARLFWGGFVGPVAAFLYLFGFIGVFLNLDAGKMRNAVFAIFGLAIVIGGAYHSQFTHIGVVGKLSEEALLRSWDISVIYLFVIFGMFALASLLFSYMVLRRQSLLSRKVVFFSPLPMMLLGSILMDVMVQPFSIIIGGGWYNIMMFIFFIAVWKGNKQYVAEQATA